MRSLLDSNVLVLGLGASGEAACQLLRVRGAHVTALDQADTPSLQTRACALERLGVRVQLGATTLPAGQFDLAVLSPGLPSASPLVRETRSRNIPAIGELELGYQQSLCLNVSITGTNGKTTTTELVEQKVTHA